MVEPHSLGKPSIDGLNSPPDGLHVSRIGSPTVVLSLAIAYTWCDNKPLFQKVGSQPTFLVSGGGLYEFRRAPGGLS